MSVELPKLPEASAPQRYICTECGYVGEVGPTHVKPNSDACHYLALTIPEMFTADQMREYGRAVERAAYAKAAQECDGLAHEPIGLDENTCLACADAIRALGSKT